MIKKLFGEKNMGKKQGQIWLRLLGIFGGVVAVFVLLLTLVMCIPNSAIMENYNKSMEIFEEEGDGWKRVYTYASGSMLDNLADRIIIAETVVNENCSPISNAMSGNGYSRYWHGYLSWVRPMLLFFSYLDIRYILMFVFMFLMSACVLRINDRLGRAYSWIFTLCMTLVYFIMIPWSLQFCEVFLITMGTMLYVLKRHDSSWDVFSVGEMFLVIGMITQYLDFLTAPLLTLGMPLVIILLLNIKENGADSKLKNWAVLIHSCITWAIGWALSLAAKLVIGTLVLGRNIIEDAFNQVAFRVNGNEDSQVNRIAAIVKNIYSSMPFSNVIGKGEKRAIIIVGIVYIAFFAAIIFLWIRYRRKSMWVTYLPVFAAAFLPIAWFIVMAQHSQVHFFYTYRIMIITWFAVLAGFTGCIDWNAVRRGKHSEQE